MKFICFSDTHGQEEDLKIPKGDVIICAGDFSSRGQLDDVEIFGEFLSSLPHKYKIVIAGNHDKAFEYANRKSRKIFSSKGIIYLEDSYTIINGLKIYGSPWQPEFNNWAFNLPRRSVALRNKREMIPADTDILVTHGPPKGILDQVDKRGVGCEELQDVISKKLKNLRHHVFGHIHSDFGEKKFGKTTFHNVSVLSESYELVNPVTIFDFEKGKQNEKYNFK